jgi:type VI secretion system protein
MPAISLLRRLERAADPTSAARSRFRGEDLESAVLEHLQRLLNTRQGSALTAPDYGVIELSEMAHDFPDATGLMQRCLKNTIAKYEPRLKNVQVRAIEPDEDDNPTLAYFEISAQLVYPNGERQGIRFSTSVDESSNVRIR